MNNMSKKMKWKLSDMKGRTIRYADSHFDNVHYHTAFSSTIVLALPRLIQ